MTRSSYSLSLYRYDIGDGNIPVNDIIYITNTLKSTKSELIQPITWHANKPSDYVSHIPHFAWQSADIIKLTFDATAQYMRAPMSNFPKRYYISSFLALNIHWRKEAVHTNAIYSRVPAVVSGDI